MHAIALITLLYTALLAAPVRAEALGGISSIDAGYGHTCALDSPGNVICWGRNHEGQLGDGTQVERRTAGSPVVVGSKVQAIALGAYHTCALTITATVRCWGSNLGGQVNPSTRETIIYQLTAVDVPGLDPVVRAVSAGFNHSCAITATTTVKCWGTNDFGQLGDGTTSRRDAPVEVSGLGAGIVAVSAAVGHTCALTAAGAVKCWGYNATGQLGNGSATGSLLPVQVVGLDRGVTAVSAGDGRTCARTATSNVKCWGLGLGSGPIDIPFGSGLASVDLGTSGFAQGSTLTCTLSMTGDVSCTGPNDRGQLGVNFAISSVGWPVRLPAAASAIAVGGTHACALLVTGAVACWGDNSQGARGDGQTNMQAIPTPAFGISGRAVSVSAGMWHTCVVGDGGRASCSGRNSGSELGWAPTFQWASQTGIGGLSGGVKAIAAGNGFSCALIDGGVKCWGSSPGAVGDGGAPGIRSTPSRVANLPLDIKAIAAGGSHACALTAGGAMACWGSNSSGQLGDGSNNTHNAPIFVTGLSSDVTAMALGSEHSCAVLTTGALRCWGLNRNGQVGDGTTANTTVPKEVIPSGVKAAAAGDSHTCVVMNSGGVRCWGDNTYGQVGTGTPPALTTAGDVPVREPAIAISAGGTRTCVIIASLGAQCWGGAIYGAYIPDMFNGVRRTPLDVVGLVEPLASISVSATHFCAITTAGSLLCWGNNLYGEIGNNTAQYLAQWRYVMVDPFPYAVEFRHVPSDRYFISADEQEIFAIDNGAAGPGWARTGGFFAIGGDTPVCRFYGSVRPGPNSHFFALDGFECAALRAMQFAADDPRRAIVPSWNFESYAFRATASPASIVGTCPVQTVPVFRAYNRGDVRGLDSNHRLTTSRAAIDEVVARGWVDEGVAMCVPMLPFVIARP